MNVIKPPCQIELGNGRTLVRPKDGSLRIRINEQLFSPLEFHPSFLDIEDDLSEDDFESGVADAKFAAAVAAGRYRMPKLVCDTLDAYINGGLKMYARIVVGDIPDKTEVSFLAVFQHSPRHSDAAIGSIQYGPAVEPESGYGEGSVLVPVGDVAEPYQGMALHCTNSVIRLIPEHQIYGGILNPTDSVRDLIVDLPWEARLRGRLIKLGPVDAPVPGLELIDVGVRGWWSPESLERARPSQIVETDLAMIDNSAYKTSQPAAWRPDLCFTRNFTIGLVFCEHGRPRITLFIRGHLRVKRLQCFASHEDFTR